MSEFPVKVEDISQVKKKMSFEKLAKIASYEGSGAVILGRGYSGYGIEPLDFMTGTGNGGTGYSFTAQTVGLGVDMETGKIDVNDVTAIQLYIAQNQSFTDKQKEAADVNKDGKISVLDVTRVQQYIARSFDEF